MSGLRPYTRHYDEEDMLFSQLTPQDQARSQGSLQDKRGSLLDKQGSLLDTKGSCCERFCAAFQFGLGWHLAEMAPTICCCLVILLIIFCVAVVSSALADPDNIEKG
jgi:hypothetical protein